MQLPKQTENKDKSKSKENGDENSENLPENKLGLIDGKTYKIINIGGPIKFGENKLLDIDNEYRGVSLDSRLRLGYENLDYGFATSKISTVGWGIDSSLALGFKAGRFTIGPYVGFTKSIVKDIVAVNDQDTAGAANSWNLTSGLGVVFNLGEDSQTHFELDSSFIHESVSAEYNGITINQYRNGFLGNFSAENSTLLGDLDSISLGAFAAGNLEISRIDKEGFFNDQESGVLKEVYKLKPRSGEVSTGPIMQISNDFKLGVGFAYKSIDNLAHSDNDLRETGNINRTADMDRVTKQSLNGIGVNGYLSYRISDDWSLTINSNVLSGDFTNYSANSTFGNNNFRLGIDYDHTNISGNTADIGVGTGDKLGITLVINYDFEDNDKQEENLNPERFRE